MYLAAVINFFIQSLVGIRYLSDISHFNYFPNCIQNFYFPQEHILFIAQIKIHVPLKHGPNES